MKTQHTAAEYTLTVNEMQRFISQITDFRDRCIVKCLYYCGMRVSEVPKLRIEHIDFERERLTIFESKGGKTRTIPIIDESLLPDLKIFIGNRKAGEVFAMTPRNIQYLVQRWAEKCKLQNPHPYRKHLNCHLCRHSCARHLKSAGYSAEFIQKFLGHSSIKTTMDVYGTLSLDEMQQIIYQKQGRTPIGTKEVKYLQ